MSSQTVTSIMTANPEVVRAGDSLLVVKKMFEKQQFHHHIPVVDNGTLAGMISLYDFIIAMRGASLDDTEPVYASKTAGDIMSREVKSCTPETTIASAVAIMLEHHINALPVVENTILRGIVTSRDLMATLL
ncbi:MAG: HPP family protein [Flavobacteriales bacterium]|jgi:CBS domain-containing protein